MLFANKHGYKVSASQELLANGVCNVVGAFFSSLPISASLSRSSVQVRERDFGTGMSANCLRCMN